MEPDIAYVGGLLCDVGASFLLWLAAERAISDGRPFDLESCMASVRASHQEIAVAVLNGWNAEPQVVALAGTHHAESISAPDPYWSLQVLAEQFAIDVVGADPTAISNHGLASVELCERELGIGVDAVERVSQRLTSELAGILETLS